MTHGWTTTASEALTPDQVDAVLALVDEAAAADGSAALNEAALLHLRHPHPGVLHLLAAAAPEPDRPVPPPLGYAQLDPGGAASTGQLVVRPESRRGGVGSALLDELLRRAPSRLQLWALGDPAAARALAARRGLVRARELLVMTRSLAEPVEQPEPAPGVVLRAFVPGADEDAWLALNARAFAAHPEQGSLTRADLDERMAEDWFDAAGFFLAARGEELVGFHWTKQHPDRVGEVYVLGVDPTAGGRGLGKVLLGRGLAHLRDRGDETVLLYVEGDHDRAVGLYRTRGFTVASRDVMYAQPEREG